MIVSKFTNRFGEELTLRIYIGNKVNRNQIITFNHSDIHDDEDEFEDIKVIGKYVLNAEEIKFIELTIAMSIELVNLRD